MYSDWVVLALGGFLALWLGILTYFILRQGNFLKDLFPKSGERDIRKKFEEVLKELREYKVDLDKIKDKLTEIEKLDLTHIQKVKLLRYNPYGDTGGDQSFTLAMLNDKGDGVVITSLHTRSVTRVFAKPVEAGKALKYEFSGEERKAIEEAISRA